MCDTSKKVADLERWQAEVMEVANRVFKLDGCCHWETICEAIEGCTTVLVDEVAESVVAALAGPRLVEGHGISAEVLADQVRQLVVIAYAVADEFMAERKRRLACTSNKQGS